MDDEVPRTAEPDDPGLPESVRPPADDLTSEEEELRRLIDAGASSPEELRALAARIREHRALEEERWRIDVRPALLKSKKRAFSLGDLRDRREKEEATNSSLGLGLALLGIVLVLLLVATQLSPLWILVPVAAVLLYAYRQGRQADEAPPADPPTEDPPG